MGEYFNQIFEFSWAVINNWAGYATGGIVVALVWLWSTVYQKIISRRLGVALALSFLFFAFFTAWREQYLKTHPGLKLEVLQLGVADGHTQNDCKIFISASIKNNGMPSVADYWELFVQTSGHNPVKAEIQYIDPSQPLTFNLPGGQTAKLSSEDVLYNKTMKQPIQTGMKEVGILSFGMKMPRKDIEIKGTKFLLQCRDVNGNFIRVEQTWEDVSMPLMFFPGMNPPPK